MSQDTKDLTSRQGWLGTILWLLVFSGVIGFWIAVVEVIFSWSGALFERSNELLLLRLIGGLSDPLILVHVRDNLVGLTLAGLISGLFAAIFYVPVATKYFGLDRDRSHKGALFIVVSTILLLGIIFYAPGIFPYFRKLSPISRLLVYTIPAAALIIFQYHYYKRIDSKDVVASLVFEGLWGMGALKLIKVIASQHGLIGIAAFVALALAAIIFCYLGFRLSRTAARALLRRVSFARIFRPAIVLISVILISYTMYFHFSGFKRLPFNRQASPGPNIVLLVLDTVRADRLSCYGYSRQTTPFIDRVAKDGIKFNRAFTPSPWTLPSHASFFTGLYPSEHQCINGHWWLDDAHVTLAEQLKERGYLTLGYSCNPWIRASSNLDQGFDLLLHPRNFYIGTPSFTGEALWGAWLYLTDIMTYYLDNGAGQANAVCRQWISALARREQPFFLFVNYMEAHSPYPFHDDSYHFFPSVREGKEQVNDAHFNWIDHDSGNKTFNDQELEIIRTWYDGSIYYLDRRVEELVTALRDSGLSDNTVLIILSDHGENLGEHGLWGHEFSMYTSLLHVPLIISYPALPRGKVVEKPFSLLELPQLVMDIVKGKMPRALAGDGSNPEKPKAIFAERFAPVRIIDLFGNKYPGFKSEVFDRDQKSVIKYPYHMIWDSKGADELYRIDEDPGEINNRIKLQRNVYYDLDLLITGFLTEHPEPLLGEGKEGKLDEQARRKLRALGYLE